MTSFQLLHSINDVFKICNQITKNIVYKLVSNTTVVNEILTVILN